MSSLIELPIALAAMAVRGAVSVVSAVAGAAISGVEAISDSRQKAKKKREEAQKATTQRINQPSPNLSGELAKIDSDQRKRLNDLQKNLDKQVSDMEDRMMDTIENNNKQLKEQVKQQMADAARETDRKLQNLSAQTQSQIQGINKKIDAQTKRQAKINNQLQQKIDNLARETDTRFEHQAEINVQLQDGINQAIAGINALAAETDRQFQRVQDQLDRQDRKIDQVKATVDGLLARERDQQSRRQAAVKMVRDYWENTMRRSPNIAQYCPDELADLRRHIEALGAVEGAEGQVSQLIVDIQLLEEEALKRQAKWESVHRMVSAKVDAVLRVSAENREKDVPYPGDPESAMHVEADYWTRGLYSEAEQRLQTLRAELQGHPSIERMEKIMQEVGELEQQINQLLELAASEAVRSEQRVEQTENIVDVLIDQGWQVKQETRGDQMEDALGYMGGEEESDWREGVFVIMEGPSGEQMTIHVDPTQEGHVIGIDRTDQRPLTDQSFAREMRELSEVLQRGGIPVEAPAPNPNASDTACTQKARPEMADPAKLRQKGTAQRIRQQQ